MSGVIELGRNTHNACQTTVATISTMLWTLLVFIPLIQVIETMFLLLAYSVKVLLVGSSDYQSREKSIRMCSSYKREGGFLPYRLNPT